MNFTELSDCELLVMKCLWEENKPMSVTELLERIKNDYGKEYKETTVYTFLKRMKEKGYVTSYKKGTSYYSPLVSEKDYLEDYSKKMAEFWGERSSKAFLSAFFRCSNYSEQEWDEIRRLSDEMD